MSPKLRDNHNNKLSLILPPPLLDIRDTAKNKMYLIFRPKKRTIVCFTLLKLFFVKC